MLRSLVVRRMLKMGSEDRSTGVLSLLYRLHEFKFQRPLQLRNAIGP